MENAEPLKLITMRDVDVEEVEWLWRPYIPVGKITIVQGDGGDGKTTMVLAIAAAVTRGIPLPECAHGIPAGSVVYQTAEDGLADTVKPRLLALEADCARVHVIDESDRQLTLSDGRIERAITETGAKLFILDPLQAYLGAGVDMHRANEVRPVLRRLGDVAGRTGCAVVIVGHLNKSGGKGQYRGLGSVDIFAAARSVLTLGRIRGKRSHRAFAHCKSNLAPEGASIAFELDAQRGFQWIGEYDVTLDELLNGAGGERECAYDRAVDFLKKELSSIAIPATEVFRMAAEQGISKRTLYKAKSALGVHSFRQGEQWYWSLPDSGDSGQDCKAATLQLSMGGEARDAALE